MSKRSWKYSNSSSNGKPSNKENAKASRNRKDILMNELKATVAHQARLVNC